MGEKQKTVLLIEREPIGVKPGRIFCNIQDGTLSVSFYVNKVQKSNLRQVVVLGYIPGVSPKDVINFLDGRLYRGEWFDIDLNKIKELETKYTNATLYKDVLAHYGSAITSDPLVLARITALEDKMSKLTKGFSALASLDIPAESPVAKAPEDDDEVVEKPKAPAAKAPAAKTPIIKEVESDEEAPAPRTSAPKVSVVKKTVTITPCNKCYRVDYHQICSSRCLHCHHVSDDEVVEGNPEDVYSCSDCYRKIYKPITGASKSCKCRKLSMNVDKWDCQCGVKCASDRNCPCACHTRSRVQCGYCEKKPGCHNPGVEFSSCGHSCHLVCVGKCCEDAGDHDIATTCDCYCHDSASVPPKSKKITPAEDSDDE